MDVSPGCSFTRISPSMSKTYVCQLIDSSEKSNILHVECVIKRIAIVWPTFGCTLYCTDFLMISFNFILSLVVGSIRLEHSDCILLIDIIGWFCKETLRCHQD